MATIIDSESPDANAEMMFGTPALQKSSHTQRGRNNIKVLRIKGQKPPNNSSDPSSIARIVVAVNGSTGIMRTALRLNKQQNNQRNNPQQNAHSNAFALTFDCIIMYFSIEFKWVEE